MAMAIVAIIVSPVMQTAHRTFVLKSRKVTALL